MGFASQVSIEFGDRLDAVDGALDTWLFIHLEEGNSLIRVLLAPRGFVGGALSVTAWYAAEFRIWTLKTVVRPWSQFMPSLISG